MKEVKVMLVCGGGASSGFLASSMRKAARKKGIVMDIFAKSESDVENFKNDIDILLLGPHLKYLEEEIKDRIANSPVKLAVIENKIYGSLDGELAVEKVLQMMEE